MAVPAGDADGVYEDANVNFLSICSGIEAASVAWKPLGWKAVGFAEIEPFPSAVLAVCGSSFEAINQAAELRRVARQKSEFRDQKSAGERE